MSKENEGDITYRVFHDTGHPECQVLYKHELDTCKSSKCLIS